MRFKELIYDFDGTLSDSYPCLTNAFLDTLEYYGLSDSYENVYAKLKISVGHCKNSYEFPAPIEEVSKKYKEYHLARAYDEQHALPGAAEILKYAADMGCRNFIYTHSATLPAELLEKWGLDGYFTEIVNKTYGFPGKPAPDALNYLVGKYDLDLTQCLMIGDRDIDTECGKNAGMAGCLYDPEHYYDGTYVEYRITDLRELKKII